MKTELQYRSFQEVVESAVLDLPHLGLEGAFDPQPLLKVVTKINYLLGLKINPRRTVMLELRHGKAKLPDDFSVANFATLCSDRQTVDLDLGLDWQLGGRQHPRAFISVQDPVAVVGSSSETVLREYATTLTLQPGPNRIAHNLDAARVLVQTRTGPTEIVEARHDFVDSNTLVLTNLSTEAIPAVAVRVLASGRPAPETEFFQVLDLLPGDTLLTHTLPSQQYLLQLLSAQGEILDCDIRTQNANQLVLHSEDVNPVVGARLLLLSTRVSQLIAPSPCPVLCEVVDTERELLVRYQRTYGQRQEYRRITPLRFSRPRGLSTDCQALVGRGAPEVYLENGFLIGPCPDGHVLLSYLSVLEDEAGQLLTLDHPKVNDYYEYALKTKVYEGLWLAGEDVERKLGYLKTELRSAKYEGLSFINTPDYAEFQRIWERNRRQQYAKYYAIFQSH